jgi:hypothetical protein
MREIAFSCIIQYEIVEGKLLFKYFRNVFWRAFFEFFALTLVAILSEPDEDSQSLEAWLLRFLEFMSSIDCDSNIYI